MIHELLISLCLLHPVYHETETMLWGGKVHSVFNQDGLGLRLTLWPETNTVIFTYGYRGKWLKVFRLW